APPRPGPRPAPRNGTPPPGPRRDVPVGTWVGLYVDGARVLDQVSRSGYMARAGADDRPDAARTARDLDRLVGHVRDGASSDGEHRFRVAAKAGNGAGDVVVVAVPTDDVEATLSRLLRIELVVGSIAALAVLLLSWVIVRAGLRPLDRIAAAAADVVADGDGRADELGARVPPGAPGTEVGRLSGAINEMLDRIDAELAARRRTEAQLRRFVADASHELRTPLTSILGYAELARARGADMSADELAETLATLERETQHLGGLVGQLLLLARLDEDLVLERAPVDVAKVARHAVDAARVVEPGRVVTLDADGAATLDADPVRVRQLLDNLLANVRTHAGDAASATVHVRTLEPEEGRRVVEVCVADTGRGLPDGDHDRALERFWRADAARGTETGGAGLGLSIVEAIAAAHGGSVSLSPAADGSGGLAVTVTLRD
ncbi:MAG: hypothetical protein JWM98_1700, partial [Thermoleophilia bacterium]|nr:hypothetical protein [Thermoleophilia bacterium]